MTLRDAVNFIKEAQDVINSSLGLTDGYDVKECLEEALEPLEEALKAIEEALKE